MEYDKPFLLNSFTFNDLHGYLVENPIQTLMIRRHIVFLVWFIKKAWAACDNYKPNLSLKMILKSHLSEALRLARCVLRDSFAIRIGSHVAKPDTFTDRKDIVSTNSKLYCSLPLYLAHAKENASKASAKHEVGGGMVGFANEAERL